MNICIAGQAAPVAWMPHLVSAFQKRGNVITIGPVPSIVPIGSMPESWPAPGHIDCPLDQIRSLLDVLPPGWVPDILVTVSGGGVPLLTCTHDLSCPTVFYSVDTWQCYMDYREALHYDIVFAGQRAFVPLLRAAGCQHVSWLPLACEPAVHNPLRMVKTSDIGFVGGTREPVHWRRRALLDALRARHSVIVHDGLYGDSMRRALAECKLVFNHSAVDDVNMRIFEVLAMGGALLTNRTSQTSGLFDLFTEGEHLIVYDDEKDLLAKASHFVTQDAECMRIAMAGKSLVHREHTYDHRVDTILNTVAGLFPGFPAAGARESDRFDFLPKVPGRLLDIGMAVPASKHGLLRRGVRTFSGYARNEEVLTKRRGSYHDAGTEMTDRWRESFDTAVIGMPPFDGEFDLAYGCLAPGGALVARYPKSPEIDSEHSEEFIQHGFHVVRRFVDSEHRRVIWARKRTRHLRDIAREVCQTLWVPGVDGEHVASLLDPEW
ncbi:MAG: glycosyltransferase [Candidatus Hydrogenedentes bacterium]|nr:glycosyltransferase [Candidatus Hydrogenedentota bacterium]